MAAVQDGKTFKQDMVVSIRYRNDLPPPPMPPKLLDIDTGGLQQYLTTSYASALARREEPNIEVDAEGGMPIDMVGVPGYFLGDENAIMAPELQPVLDAADTALLLTPDQLRTGGAQTVGTSFLRKTQYMTSGAGRATDPLMATQGRVRKTVDKKIQPVLARDDKENIRRNLQKGFDIAYPDTVAFNPPELKSAPITQVERDAWRNPVHPDSSKSKIITPVAYYPLLPDLDAVTDASNSWNSIKFEKPPLPALHDRRDKRIDTSFFQALVNEGPHRAWQARKDAYDQDPQNYEEPGEEPLIWTLYVPRDPNSTSKVRRMFNEADPEKDDSATLAEFGAANAEGTLRIPFSRVRPYTNVKRQHPNPRRFMALSLYDAGKAPSNSRLRSNGFAAYYYPIYERTTLKAGRGKVGKSARAGGSSQAEESEDITSRLPDELMMLPAEANAMRMEARYADRAENDTLFKEQYDEIVKAANAEKEAEQADDIVQEQGVLHKGAQDVTMDEVEAAGEMEVRTNGVGHKDRDDQLNGHGDEDADADMLDD